MIVECEKHIGARLELGDRIGALTVSPCPDCLTEYDAELARLACGQEKNQEQIKRLRRNLEQARDIVEELKMRLEEQNHGD